MDKFCLFVCSLPNISPYVHYNNVSSLRLRLLSMLYGTISSVRMYWIAIAPSSMQSRTLWWRMSICFVLARYPSDWSSFIALWLSHTILMFDLFVDEFYYSSSCFSHIASYVINANAMYSASAVDKAIVGCHNLESRDIGLSENLNITVFCLYLMLHPQTLSNVTCAL